MADLHEVLLLVGIEGDGLLGDTLHGFQDVVVADGETAVAVTVRQYKGCTHGVLPVGSRQDEFLTVDVEHEIAQNGEGILAVDHFRKC